jgi:hypothetical protein
MVRTVLFTAGLVLAFSADAVSAACTCGYKLTKYNNTYFRRLLNADFTTSTLSGTATSASWLSSYGFLIEDGFQTGGQSDAADHTTPIASYKNVRIQNGVLQLVVPGGQKITNGGTTSVAGLEGPSGIINGVLTMNAKIDATPGTCQSIVSTLPIVARGVQLTRQCSSPITTRRAPRTNRILRSSALIYITPGRTEPLPVLS